MLNAAEILRPTIYPVVGERRVRPLCVSEHKEELEHQLSEKKAQHNSALASRAQALATYKEANREVKRIEYHITQLQKKLAKCGCEND